MGPRVDPVASDTTIPPQAAVVIVGAGIVGVSAAFALARKGVSVVLCEKGHVGGEQSSRNWGWCRKMGRDPRELPLIIESLRFWQGMNEAVGGETGFRTCGILYLCETEKDEARRTAWLEHARPYQLDTHLIGADEIARLMPGAARRFRAALYTPSDGRAEPQKAAPAIAEGARQAGAVILTDCAVRSVETSGGRVVAAVTEKGRIACDCVLLAGGAWSRLFCGNLGVDLKQLKVRSSVMRTEKLDGAPEISASGAEFGFRKRLDGGYTVANLNASVTEVVPDSFRLARDFLPLWRSGQARVQVRVSGRFMEEARTPRHWSPDKPSPFEAVRVLDPEPLTRLNRPGPGVSVQRVSGVCAGESGAAMGGHDRRDAGCGAGDFRGPRHAGVLHGHRFLRSWVRYRACRRSACRRPDHRRSADRRSDGVPVRSFQRRQSIPADDRAVTGDHV